MKKKRYEDGGEVEFESKQGQNPGIGDDVRERARKFIESGSPEQKEEKAKPKVAKKAPAKETPKTTSYRPPEEKGLERVSPELDILPIGKAAAALGAGYAAARALGKRMLTKRAQKEAGEKAAKDADTISKLPKKEQEARKERYLSTGPMEDAFGKGTQFKREFKSGGKVSSASRRADGCAVRGKTRA